MIKKVLIATALTALATGAASAADLPRRAAPPVFTAIPVFTWTGFYAGTHTGYVNSDNGPIRTVGNNGVGAGAGPLLAPNFTNTVNNVNIGRRPASIRAEQDAVTKLGGGFGYNYQFTPGSGFVVGVEAAWTWTDLTKQRLFVSNGFNDPSSFRQSLDWLGTVTGRLGYAFDRILVYGTGGFAYGNVQYDANFFSNAGGNPLAYAGRYDALETGYVYGGGIEYAIPVDSFLNRFNFIGPLLKADAVTLKAEYLRYDLGSRSIVVDSINPATGAPRLATANGSYTSRFRTEGELIRVGFNYKFGSF